MDFLEYSDISADVKGTQTKGRLKMTDQNIVFKNNKTGKVEQINAADMDFVNFQRMLDTYGIRIFMKNGTLHRFSGFKDNEQEKIASFFKNNYKQEMLEKELSFRGWNWGTAQFSGSLLSFNVENKTSFEIPLDVVSQCTTGKNEVTLEFHQNDEGPVSLMEMRFHIPTTETSDTDPVDGFYQNVMNKASVISVSGDAIAIFREIHCLTPRGRYDIKIFQTFFQLHGKTFDYKIPMSTVLRLFLLPHKDNRQMFFVLSLDPPIKQGQTRYHYLVILFNMEDETSIELPFSDDDLKNKYESKLTKELNGPVYEVLGKIMKVLINRKLTGPGSFIGHSGTPAVSCSFKAAAGYLYPLERGFIYVHKPPLHIRFEEISAVNFARSGGSTRSFDFEVELRQGTVHTFSSIEKEEYNKLFDFITSKKLHVKNTGKGDKTGYSMDDFGNSDNENEPDAYLARVKAEAKERDDDDDDDQNSDESTDEDFKPNEQESDVAEEFDSNASSSNSSDDSEGSGGGGGGDKPKKAKEKSSKEPKEKKKKESSGKKEKSSSKSTKSSKSKKDDGRPKRPSTAFMIFMGENREKIKTDNPGISFTDIARKAGEIWKEMTDKSVYEEKAAKEKEKYTEAMKNYKPSKAEDSDNEDGGGGAAKGKKRKKESSSSAAAAAAAAANSPKKVATTMAGGGFKSKEYISEEDSSSDGGSGSDKEAKKKQKKKNKKASPPKKAKSPPKKKPEPRKKGAKSDNEDDEEVDELPDDEEEMTTTEESESGDDSD